MSHYSITCIQCGYQIELNRRDYRIEEWLRDKNRKFECPTCGGRGEVEDLKAPSWTKARPPPREAPLQEEDLKARRTKARPPPREAPPQEKEAAVRSRAQRLVTERGWNMKIAMEVAVDPTLVDEILGSTRGSIDEHTPGYPRPGTNFNTDEDIKKGRKRYDGN